MRKSSEIPLLQDLQLKGGKFKDKGVKGLKEVYGKHSKNICYFVDLMDKRYMGLKIPKIELKKNAVAIVYYNLPHSRTTHQFLWHLTSITPLVARELIGYELEKHWRDILRRSAYDEI